MIVIKKIKLYQDPELDEEGRPITKPLTEEEIKQRLKSPLKEGVLKYNCGVPIVFVINKSDAVIEHQNKRKIEEDSEFILSHIRLLALDYGATIIYTSGKANINLTVLYDYICHILFNFELAHKPNFIEKEAYFIPAGYDDLKLLNSNEEINKYLEEPYEFKIKQEIREREIFEEDIQCEDTNTFFENLKQMGVKGKDKGTSKNKINASSSFVEFKKSNLSLTDMKNYETNIPSSRNPISQMDKDKKYVDKRKELKEKISINSSFNKRDVNSSKEIKGKETGDEKKKRVREEMLMKIKRNKLSKPLEKGGTKK